jgi:hypothetical protein
MKKTYFITETQYKKLLQIKNEEKKLINQINEELESKKLSEGATLNEGLIDTIKKYLRAGALTLPIIISLLSSQKVDAQQLQQAGVPQEMVSQAMQKVKFNPIKMSDSDIENRLVRIMKQNNETGSLQSFMKLNPQQKQNVISGIRSKIKSLDDINHISLSGWDQYQKSGGNLIQFDQQSQQRIKVVTVDTVSTVPLIKFFVQNSSHVQNPQQLKAQLDSLVKDYTEIDSIVVTTSSSTLRNRGEAENMTWKQLSDARANEIAQMLIGQNIDLGGEGVNIVGKITADMIKFNTNGTNGDGTSGPKSPYEVSPEYQQNYQERGIDPKFWQSASKENALPEEQIDQYQQYQQATIKIYGRVVETQTEDVPSYRYISLEIKKLGGKIDVGQKKMETDVSKCPIKQEKHKMQLPK